MQVNKTQNNMAFGKFYLASDIVRKIKLKSTPKIYKENIDFIKNLAKKYHIGRNKTFDFILLEDTFDFAAKKPFKIIVGRKDRLPIHNPKYSLVFPEKINTENKQEVEDKFKDYVNFWGEA